MKYLVQYYIMEEIFFMVQCISVRIMSQSLVRNNLIKEKTKSNFCRVGQLLRTFGVLNKQPTDF